MKIKRVFSVVLILCLILCACGTPLSDANAATATILSPGQLEVHFIDVGQGDAALIICNGSAMLIDGGTPEASQVIYSYLNNHLVASGISVLEYVICSHAHSDHCGGLPAAYELMEVKNTFCSATQYDSKSFRNFAKRAEKSGGIIVPSSGESFYLGDALITILGPISESENTNDNSIVLRIDFGETSFLFTGDAETNEEQEILEADCNLECTVLKVGHHGSNTSTGYHWLREINPEYAVISCGTGNEYGHPTEDTLSKLRDADVSVYRTDMQGHIICTSDGKSVQFRVEKNADADTLAGSGLSGNRSPIPDYETFILNENSKRFHLPSCSSVKDIRQPTPTSESRDALIKKGYSPCGKCKP